MKQMELRKLIREQIQLLEKYKFSDVVIDNVPSNKASIADKLIWSHNVVKTYMKTYEEYTGKQVWKKLVWLQNYIKETMAGYIIANGYEMPFESEEEPPTEAPIDDSENDFSFEYDAYVTKDRDNIDKKKIDDIYHMLTNDIGWPNRIGRKPVEERIDVLWPKVLDTYEKLRELESEIEKSKNLYDKITGQSDPKLSLEMQKQIRKGEIKITDEIGAFVFGSKRYNLDAEMKLDSDMDLFVFPEVPTGGRLAQTMPETLLINFFRRMKQNVLAMSFKTDRFMEFIERFIGFKNVKKWFKTDQVYRIDSGNPKKDWLSGSTELEGIEEYIHTMLPNLKKTVYLYGGKIKYFDLKGYMNYISKELGFSSSDVYDSEKEVLFRSKNLKNMDIIKEFNEYEQIKDYFNDI